MKERKSKKKLIIPALLALLIIIIGASYAAFNYSFIGGVNTISSSEISLDLLESDDNVITIQNALPMSDANGKAQSETFDFAVTSKAKKTIDVGYSIILEKLEVDSGYTSFDDDDIKLYLTDYNDTELMGPVLIAQIKDNVLFDKTNSHDSTHEIIQNKFKLRVWIDPENVNMFEWNQNTKLQYKFRIGVRENNQVHLHNLLYNIVADGAELDTNVDFSSSPTGVNKKYIFNSTKDDRYPVYYYRGKVDNNYVKFGGFCWKAVRTTSTGGTKLIYNGSSVAEYTTNPETGYSNINNPNNFTFDSSDNSWNLTLNNLSQKELSFNVPAGTYTMKITDTTTSTTGYNFIIYKNSSIVNRSGNGGGYDMNFTHNYDNLTSTDLVKIAVTPSSTNNYNNGEPTLKLQMLKNGTTPIGDVTIIEKCSNNSDSIGSGRLKWNSYMYGKDPVTITLRRNNIQISKEYTYNSETGMYTLTNPITSSDKRDGYYSCAGPSSCRSLKFLYAETLDQNEFMYIELNGKSIDEYFADLYQNKNNSRAKQVIDTWYEANMTGYTKKLEDTVWCNDRRFTLSNSHFGSYDANMVTFQPSLSCPRLIDSFTVSKRNGNGDLTYPVALLTADEVTMAGLGTTEQSYLYSYGDMLTLTPGDISNDFNTIIWRSTLQLSTGSHYLRPSISLRHNTIVTDGDGTITNPFVIR